MPRKILRVFSLSFVKYFHIIPFNYVVHDLGHIQVTHSFEEAELSAERRREGHNICAG